MSTLLLVNERTGHLVASAVEIAATRASGRNPLAGRDRIELASAVVLTPCFAVHTAFMRTPIDVAFVDRDGRIVRLVREMQPWKAAVSLRAHAAIELAPGSLRSHDVKIGDRLCMRLVTDLYFSRATVAPRCDVESSQNSATRGCASSTA